MFRRAILDAGVFVPLLTAGLRRWMVRITMVLLLFGGSQSGWAQVERPVMPELRVRGGERGAAAIQALGARLPEVAAHYRKSEVELRGLLQREQSLELDLQGRLRYVCARLVQPVDFDQTFQNDNLPQAIFPLDQTFLLNSKPGASRVIYLDFDGHTLSGNGWTANYNGGTNIIAPPWDVDGNPASFNDSERTTIQRIWYRVAEDFSGFDVNVTTEHPGEAAITRSNNGDQNYGTRALISAISSYFGNYGGIAYLGSFDSVGDYNKPALVFPERLSNNEKNIAEAISHEVGHNLGLSHDGVTGGAEYYTGHEFWAPIMGVGYSRNITQWSKGEYANANNTQDDFAVMQQNGLAYRADDHGNSIAAARMLAGGNVSTNGIIERNTDVDFFGFTVSGGAVEITVTPWERGPNLHLSVSLFDNAGTLLTNREVADISAGVLPVTLSVALAAGTYFVSVDGTGVGNPLTTGYTDYGSLGNYTLTISSSPLAQWTPIVAGNYAWTTDAHWLSGTVPDGIGQTAYVNNNIGGSQTITLNSAVTLGHLVLGDANASHGFSLESEGSGSLTFDVSTGSAQLRKPQGADDVIATSITMLDGLVVSNTSSAELTFTGEISGNQALSISGAGTVTFAGNNSYLGATTIGLGQGPGVLRIAHNSALGAPAGNTTIGPSGNATTARLELSNDIVCPEPIIVAGRSVGNNTPAIFNLSGTNTLTGGITFQTGGTVYNYHSEAGKLILAGPIHSGPTTGGRTNQLFGAAVGEISGVIGGGPASQAVIKYDSGTWILSAANTYSGPTRVLGGALVVNGVIGSGLVTVTNGTLSGGGVIKGPVQLQNGSTLSPGTSLGTLTISNNCVQAAGTTTIMEINRELNSLDQLVCSGSLVFGGTLVVTNQAGSFELGDSFPLFTAASFAGAFNQLELPPLGPELGWQFNAANGQLSVISTLSLAPTEISAAVVSNNLQISWPPSHIGWRLEAQTNAAGAGLGAVWFDVPNANLTNEMALPIDVLNGSVFFRLVYP
jgi:autotransporter-associated beta strand protein